MTLPVMVILAAATLEASMMLAVVPPLKLSVKSPLMVLPLVLAVGPEGGFNDFENQLLERAGLTPVSLGRRVLRTEFALAALLTRLG